jgi:hypothetical protein
LEFVLDLLRIRESGENYFFGALPEHGEAAQERPIGGEKTPPQKR